MKYLISSLIALCAFGAEARSATLHPYEIVRVESLSGDGAFVIQKNGEKTQASSGMELKVGDQVLTESGTIGLRLGDGSLVKLGRNTKYKIVAIEKAKNSGLWAWSFELLVGSLRAVVRTAKKKGFVKFKVDTPAASMGVRGTEFILSHASVGNRTMLRTLKGVVLLGRRGADFNNPAMFQIVRAGQSSFIRRGAQRARPPRRSGGEEEGIPADLQKDIQELEKDSITIGPERAGLSPDKFKEAVRIYEKAQVEVVKSRQKINALNEKRKRGRLKNKDAGAASAPAKKSSDIKSKEDARLRKRAAKAESNKSKLEKNKDKKIGKKKSVLNTRFKKRNQDRLKFNKDRVSKLKRLSRDAQKKAQKDITKAKDSQAQLRIRLAEERRAAAAAAQQEESEPNTGSLTAPVLDTQAKSKCAIAPNLPECQVQQQKLCFKKIKVKKCKRRGFFSKKKCKFVDKKITVPCSQLQPTVSNDNDDDDDDDDDDVGDDVDNAR